MLNQTKELKQKIHHLNRHRERLSKRIQTLEIKSRWLSWGRLGLILGGLMAVALIRALFGELFAWAIVMLIVSGFVALVKIHNRIETSLIRHRLAHRIKTDHLSRLTLNWDCIPCVVSTSPSANHPFARDLNLTGEKSLFHLIDTTRSQQGSHQLQQWLMAPELDMQTITHRQEQVRELMTMSGFCDRLALNSALTEADLDHRWDGAAICTWLEKHIPNQSLALWVVILGALSGATLVSGVFTALDIGPAIWSVTLPVYLILYFGLYAFKSKELGALLRESDHLSHTLSPFQRVLQFLEKYCFDQTPHLKTMCAPLQENSKKPSQYLRRLRRISGAGKWQQGQLLWFMLNALVPYDLFFTHLLNRCKTQMKGLIPAWLKIWYDLEALCALATFGRFQEPVCFPQLVGTPELEVTEVGHPLIVFDARVNNQFSFQGPGDVVIVTGSNMSGKSTFLRTLGISLCLSYAGGPVPALAMKTGLFRLFTCIAVNDSVTDGLSYFYAEVKRLKTLLDELEQNNNLPLVFLIDEIFRGTNNRERLLGSRSFIRELAKHNGLGMVTTHDLDLVHLEQEISGIRNVHFRETIENGKMSFDFRLHTGPCPTTNALTIMKLEGLPVE